MLEKHPVYVFQIDKLINIFKVVPRQLLNMKNHSMKYQHLLSKSLAIISYHLLLSFIISRVGKVLPGSLSSTFHLRSFASETLA